MSKNHWVVEFAGSGILSGDFIRAEYEHTAAGWRVVYRMGVDLVATSEAPRHPSLRRLGADDAGEKRVIKTALAVIDLLEDGMTTRVRRAAKAGRKAPARRRATA